MKLVFSTLAFASGAAMAAAATLPVMVGGIAAMCFLFGKRAEARRALDERYARGEINRQEYMQRRKDSARKATRQTRLWFRKLPTGHPKRLLHRCV
jgi:hypothetical protein